MHTVSVAGLTATTVVVYLVIVVGLGQIPEGADRQLLALSMVAAGIAAALYLPARERLSDLANRLVYGERHAPDEVLRTFGSRLSRAIPMDELLLQLAESLRKTLALTRAEVWTGTEGVLERSVSVPYADAVKLWWARRNAASWRGPACRARPGSRCGCRPSSKDGSGRSCGSRR